MTVRGNVELSIYPYCSEFYYFQCLSLTLETHSSATLAGQQEHGNSCFSPSRTESTNMLSFSCECWASELRKNFTHSAIYPDPAPSIFILCPYFTCSLSKLNFLYWYHWSLSPRKFQICSLLYDYYIIYNSLQLLLCFIYVINISNKLYNSTYSLFLYTDTFQYIVSKCHIIS